ncbi:hypothetical protein [Bifidobacterium saimiriisciurei]|uniref:hypothetical protein n=1 Tax=Bifidobacterium saimiriisciurei TaxID=2661627 RepID=UPI00177F6470
MNSLSGALAQVKPVSRTTRDGLSSLFSFTVFAELAAERLVHQGVDGLCDADDAGEDDAPAVAVEAVGCGDGDDAEQDAHAEAGQAHAVGGDVLLERLYQGGCDEDDDAGGEGGRCGNIHESSP